MFRIFKNKLVYRVLFFCVLSSFSMSSVLLGMNDITGTVNNRKKRKKGEKFNSPSKKTKYSGDDDKENRAPLSFDKVKAWLKEQDTSQWTHEEREQIRRIVPPSPEKELMSPPKNKISTYIAGNFCKEILGFIGDIKLNKDEKFKAVKSKFREYFNHIFYTMQIHQVEFDFSLCFCLCLCFSFVLKYKLHIFTDWNNKISSIAFKVGKKVYVLQFRYIANKSDLGEQIYKYKFDNFYSDNIVIFDIALRLYQNHNDDSKTRVKIRLVDNNVGKEIALIKNAFPNYDVRLDYLIEHDFKKAIFGNVRKQNEDGMACFIQDNIFNKINNFYQLWLEKYYIGLLGCMTLFLGYVKVFSEISTKDGRIDLLLETDNDILLIEAKRGESAKNAIQQIEERKYTSSIPMGKPIYKIGFAIIKNYTRKDSPKSNRKVEIKIVPPKPGKKLSF